MGTLVRQLWSVAGPSDRPNVSQLLLQPFFNYNMAEGWYLVSSPIITANWKATSGSKWAFPIGRRHRQDFQDRRSAYECFAAGLRLRGVANWWTAMGRGCVKTPALRLRVENLSRFRQPENKNTDDPYGGKTIEKTMLRVLRACMFSHSLGRLRPIAIPFSALTARPDRPSPFRSDYSRVHQFAAVSRQTRQRPLLIHPHQARVPRHVGG